VEFCKVNGTDPHDENGVFILSKIPHIFVLFHDQNIALDEMLDAYKIKDPHLTQILDLEGEDGTTPYIEAVSRKYDDVIKYLHNKGANTTKQVISCYGLPAVLRSMEKKTKNGYCDECIRYSVGYVV